MDPSLAVTLLLLLGAFLLWFHNKPRSPHPPSPPRIPILGHLHYLIGNAPHRSLTKIARKYGPIVRLELGSTPFYFISSPEMSKELLKTQDHLFASRPRNMATELLAYESKDLIASPYGEYWRRVKALLAQELLSEKKIGLFREARLQEISTMMSRIYEASRAEKAVDIQELLDDFAYNVLTHMILGRTYCGNKPSVTEQWEIQELYKFRKATHQVITIAGEFHPVEFIPWLKWFVWTSDRMQNLHQSKDSLWDRIINEHRMNPGKDFVDVALSEATEATIEEQNESVKAFIQGVISAGTDAMAVSPSWALAELFRHKEHMKRLQEEIKSVVGLNRLVEEEDIPKLKFLQAVVKETFRLHPSVPLTIPHVSIQECNIGGYRIPKGSAAFVNLYAINHDPAIWNEPEVFKPERFMDEDVNIHVAGHTFKLTPFGSGRRSCPGSGLGLLSIHLLLANLVHAFNWNIPKEVSLKERFGIVLLMVDKIEGTPTARLEPSVY